MYNNDFDELCDKSQKLQTEISLDIHQIISMIIPSKVIASSEILLASDDEYAVTRNNKREIIKFEKHDTLHADRTDIRMILLFEKNFEK